MAGLFGFPPSLLLPTDPCVCVLVFLTVYGFLSRTVLECVNLTLSTSKSMATATGGAQQQRPDGEGRAASKERSRHSDERIEA